MGFYRSQLYVNADSSTSDYQYAMNASDVDGSFVRTIGADGRIGQFAPATFNKPVIIPSDTQKYIYKNTRSFIDLPAFNSIINFDNLNNISYFIGNCFAYNRPITVTMQNQISYIGPSLIYDCRSFNSPILVSSNINNNTTIDCNRFIANCPAFNSLIQFDGINNFNNSGISNNTSFVMYNSLSYRQNAYLTLVIKNSKKFPKLWYSASENGLALNNTGIFSNIVVENCNSGVGFYEFSYNLIRNNLESINSFFNTHRNFNFKILDSYGYITTSSYTFANSPFPLNINIFMRNCSYFGRVIQYGNNGGTLDAYIDDINYCADMFQVNNSYLNSFVLKNVNYITGSILRLNNCSINEYVLDNFGNINGDMSISMDNVQFLNTNVLSITNINSINNAGSGFLSLTNVSGNTNLLKVYVQLNSFLANKQHGIIYSLFSNGDNKYDFDFDINTYNANIYSARLFAGSCRMDTINSLNIHIGNSIDNLYISESVNNTFGNNSGLFVNFILNSNHSININNIIVYPYNSTSMNLSNVEVKYCFKLENGCEPENIRMYNLVRLNNSISTNPKITFRCDDYMLNYFNTVKTQYIYITSKRSSISQWNYYDNGGFYNSAYKINILPLED